MIARRVCPWPVTIDRFFESHGPALLWLIAFAAYWALLPTDAAFAWRHKLGFWCGTAAAVLAWSAWLDLRFFRKVLGRTAGQALGALAVQRAISWTLVLAIFIAGSGLQVVASTLGI